jgi:hypothetical protein
MLSSKELELNDESVKVTWCACESCNSVGPRTVTLVKHHHEYTVRLDADCCTSSLEEALVSGETEHFGRHRPRLMTHIPR